MTEGALRRAWIGLGANLGDAVRAVEEAMQAIAGLPGVVDLRRSSLYRSAPVDASGPDFVNAVVEVRTTLAAPALLAALHAIEARAGRDRPFRNAPRLLDLDLLAHGDTRSADTALTLPHPRLHRRAFVLCPLLELDPALELPGLGRLADHLDAVAGQRVERIAR